MLAAEWECTEGVERLANGGNVNFDTLPDVGHHMDSICSEVGFLLHSPSYVGVPGMSVGTELGMTLHESASGDFTLHIRSS